MHIVYSTIKVWIETLEKIYVVKLQSVNGNIEFNIAKKLVFYTPKKGMLFILSGSYNIC